MQEYDVALKRILTRPGSALLASLTGGGAVDWLNVELPKVNNLRVDLLAVSASGELIHFELQSRNERDLALRMAEYFFAIWRQYGKLPRQIVLSVGEKRLRMKNFIAGPNLNFRFHLVDVRDLDGEKLLARPSLSDNVIAILTRLGSEPGTVRRILTRIADGQEELRGEALMELSILAGLRKLTGEVKREAKRMPILEDIMDNEIFGPAIRQGLAQGRAEGLVEGRVEGQMEILLRLIERKFGTVSPRIRQRLAKLQPEQLTAVGFRLLDATSAQDLFVH